MGVKLKRINCDGVGDNNEPVTTSGEPTKNLEKEQLEEMIDMLKINKDQLKNLIKVAKYNNIPIIESEAVVVPFYNIELHIPKMDNLTIKK